jgi:hypothetical protein
MNDYLVEAVEAIPRNEQKVWVTEVANNGEIQENGISSNAFEKNQIL